MTRLPMLYHDVLKELEEGPLSGEEILIRIEKRLNKKFIDNKKKVYTKAFTRLLTDKKIQIDSYVGGNKQSIDVKLFVYSKIYKTPSELSFYLKKIEKDANAKKMIKSRFLIRIEEIKNRIHYLNKNLIYNEERCLTQEELEFLESGCVFEYNLNKQIFKKRDYKIVQGRKQRIVLSFVKDKKKASLNKIYKDAKVYFFDPKITGEVSFRKNPDDSVILDKKFFKTPVTPMRILDEYHVYPSFKELEDENELFEQVLSYIITRPKKYRNDLFNDLAWALSDEKEADKFLHLLVEQALWNK